MGAEGASAVRPLRPILAGAPVLESGRQVGCGYRPSWAKAGLRRLSNRCPLCVGQRPYQRKLREAAQGQERLLHRSKSDLESFGYMTAADTVTPTSPIAVLGMWHLRKRQYGANCGYVTRRAGVSVTPFR